ncbi:MAG: RES domain-containing protein, partial [Pedobacter sp.]
MSLKTSSRFFNRDGAKHLSSVFDGIEQMKTIDNRPVIRVIGPGTNISFLYRARVFQSDEILKLALCYPDLQLGPPPSQFAPSGRMNAKGISVFYGATEIKAALAEVRPPVGSKVTIAKFELLRSLRMLDLTALSYTHYDGSIFNEAYSKLVSRNVFLKGFGAMLSRPIMPDEQDFEYLPTQAIADFLASDSELNLDGIIFSSAQSNLGLNAVLFHKASKIKVIKRTKDTTVYA